jgi:hypothetical protein
MKLRLDGLRLVGVVLTLLLGGAGRGKAAFIQSSSGLRAAQTITFDEHFFASGTPISTQYSDLGVVFSPNLYYSPLATAGLPHIDATNLSNFAGLGKPAVNPFFIVFNQPQTAADFALATADDAFSIFTALRGGLPVETATAFTSLGSRQNFYGFSGITFDAIEVTAGGPSGVMVLDNLQTGQVAAPAPPGLALLGLGALALAVYGRRRVAKLPRLGPAPEKRTK